MTHSVKLTLNENLALRTLIALANLNNTKIVLTEEELKALSEKLLKASSIWNWE